MYLRSVLHFQGYLLLFCAAFMLTAVPWSFYYGESDWQALLLSSGITVLAGGVLLPLPLHTSPAPRTDL